MLLREIKKSDFAVWIANVKVKNNFYSQWIPVQVSARTGIEAKKLIQAQYGAGSNITGLRKEK